MAIYGMPTFCMPSEACICTCEELQMLDFFSLA